jgi:hypothetical protein
MMSYDNNEHVKSSEPETKEMVEIDKDIDDYELRPVVL